MTTNYKKSFIMHKDSLTILEDLTDQQAGKLFRAIADYQLGKQIKLDTITKVAFNSFKNQFIRDEAKYNDTCKKRAIAGSKGGKQKQANATKSYQKLPIATKSKQNVTKVADSDSDSDSKNDSKKEKDIMRVYNIFAENNNLSKLIKLSKSRKRKLKSRLKEKDFDIKKIFEEAKKQSFLFGNNERGWKMSFDWLIKNEVNYLRVLENFYLDKKEKVSTRLNDMKEFGSDNDSKIQRRN